MMWNICLAVISWSMSLLDSVQRWFGLSLFSFSISSSFSSPSPPGIYRLPTSLPLTRSNFTSQSSHQFRLQQLQEQIRDCEPHQRLSLHRHSQQSNTIRNAAYKADSSNYRPVDTSSFTKIIEIDTIHSTVTLEPGITFDQLIQFCISYQFIPLVVVEFPSITVSGAINGCGLESSSFQHGQVFDTVTEMEVVLGDGKVVICSSEKEQELFYGISGSYGTLAILTSVTLKLKPYVPYVRMKYHYFQDIETAIHYLRTICKTNSQRDHDDDAKTNSTVSARRENQLKPIDDFDYCEGLVFASDQIMIMTARHCHPNEITTNDSLLSYRHHYDRWYYKHVQDLANRIHAHLRSPSSTLSSSSSSHSLLPTNEVLPYYDYVFRYNYGAFWMASTVLDLLPFVSHFVDSFLFRFLFGWLFSTSNLFSVLHRGSLSEFGKMRILQDVYTKEENTTRFVKEVVEQIGVLPLWLCPVKTTQTEQLLACHYQPSISPSSSSPPPSSSVCSLMINVGIYGRPSRFSFPFPVVQLNETLLSLVQSTGSRTMLYAQNWYNQEQFWQVYDEKWYQNVRKNTGAENKFFQLWSKVALTEKERKELSEPVHGSETQVLMRVMGQIFTNTLPEWLVR